MAIVVLVTDVLTTIFSVVVFAYEKLYTIGAMLCMVERGVLTNVVLYFASVFTIVK